MNKYTTVLMFGFLIGIFLKLTFSEYPLAFTTGMLISGLVFLFRDEEK